MKIQFVFINSCRSSLCLVCTTYIHQFVFKHWKRNTFRLYCYSCFKLKLWRNTMLGNTKLLLFLWKQNKTKQKKKLYEHADVFCKHNKFYLANQWESIALRLNSMVSLWNDTSKVMLKLSKSKEKSPFLSACNILILIESYLLQWKHFGKSLQSKRHCIVFIQIKDQIICQI